MFELKSFCENGTYLSEPWRKHGLTQCFTDTIISSVLFGMMVIFGTLQIAIYLKYGARLENHFKPTSFNYGIQMLLVFLMPLESVINFILQATVLGDKTAYMYNLLSCCFLIVAWWVVLMLIYLERHYVLPSIPTRRHGFILLLFCALAFIFQNLAFISWFSPEWWWIHRNASKKIELGLWIFRYVATGLIFFYAIQAPGVTKYERNTDEEAMLLDSTHEGQSTWKNVWKKVKLMWPYVWPKKNAFLQFSVIVCLILLIGGRVVNLLTPIYYKYIVDSLTLNKDTAEDLVSVDFGRRTLTLSKLVLRVDYISVYILLKFLQGGGIGSMGLLNNMRTLMWIKVQQYTAREIGVRLYTHLHGLSLRWHLQRKTGEVLRVMDRGSTSINNLLSYILFQIAPTIVDIIIAVIFFLTSFGAWFALIVFITMTLYLVATVVVTEWRTKYRREMNKCDNDKNAKGVDSLLNFETVKYYSAEQFEVGRYEDAIVDFQKAEFKANASLVLLNMMQNIVITIGFAVGAYLCAWYVVDDKGLSVGDFVLFATYIIQLYSPLNFLGTYYRMIQQAFIDMENMFELLSEKQEIKDDPEANTLIVSKGMIEFNDVCFHYDPERPILKNINFVVPPGKTVALVGATGSGKSTIIRLLFRFYDIQSGTIRIDGQDITKVKQDSLRKCIGVVPQDTVLFNDTIRYNIRYGNRTASDQEVEDAAAAGDIHHRIQGFPDKYNTRVGERGLKLSGGEKQRVAIARTILKAPEFVFLDEATSALDTQTERNIQSSLAIVCENRTTVIVAHRLSTIIHADQILVLREGEIVERGTHEELLGQEGMYADMWQQQLSKADDENGEQKEGERGDVKE